MQFGDHEDIFDPRVAHRPCRVISDLYTILTKDPQDRLLFGRREVMVGGVSSDIIMYAAALTPTAIDAAKGFSRGEDFLMPLISPKNVFQPSKLASAFLQGYEVIDRVAHQSGEAPVWDVYFRHDGELCSYPSRFGKFYLEELTHMTMGEALGLRSNAERYTRAT